jgi:hypothetical protein
MPTGITALELIKNSMRKLGVIATGETPTAAESTDALAALNDVIESYNIEGLTLWDRVAQSFTLVPGTASYAIGPSGALVTTPLRPVEIKGVYGSFNGVDCRAAEWTYDQYLAASVKATSELFPQRYAYINHYPNGRLFLWPTPAQAITLNIDYFEQIAALTSLATVMAFPPGYIRALQWELAGELAADYGVSINETQAVGIRSSKAMLKKSNRRPSVSRMDRSLLSGPNWSLRGGY